MVIVGSDVGSAKKMVGNHESETPQKAAPVHVPGSQRIGCFALLLDVGHQCPTIIHQPQLPRVHMARLRNPRVPVLR
jgi:hypothetical protein